MEIQWSVKDTYHTIDPETESRGEYTVASSLSTKSVLFIQQSNNYR